MFIDPPQEKSKSAADKVAEAVADLEEKTAVVEDEVAAQEAEDYARRIALRNSIAVQVYVARMGAATVKQVTDEITGTLVSMVFPPTAATPAAAVKLGQCELQARFALRAAEAFLDQLDTLDSAENGDNTDTSEPGAAK